MLDEMEKMMAKRAEEQLQESKQQAKEERKREQNMEKEMENENKKSREAIDKAVNNAQKNIDKSTAQNAAASNNWGSGIAGKSVSFPNIRIFFILIIIAHLLDMFTGFNRIGGSAVVWAIGYLLIALVAAPFWLSDDSFAHTFLSPRIFIYLAVSAFTWFLPILISKLPMIIQTNNWFKFLILLSPPWLMLVIFSGVDDNWINKIRSWWLIIWIVLLIATLIGVTASWNVPVEIQGQYEFNPLEVLKEVGDTIWTSIKKGFSKFTGVPLQISAIFNKNLNDSVGQNFMGQVDPYTQGDLGVKFTQIRTFASNFYAGQDVVVWADIQGESFNNELELILRCYAKHGSGKVYNGTVKTQGNNDGKILIKMKEKISASCTIPNLPQGYYDVVFAGAFPFETWAYIPYYFAPDELVKDLWSQNIDPAQELGIPKRPIATYTSGPVQLGLASEYDQPIGVDPIDPLRTLPPFGASVINQWTNGKVGSVRHMTLLVPEPFILKNCDRFDAHNKKKNPQALHDRVSGYREYTFGNINNPNSVFESVTCFLSLDGESYSGEVSNQQKTVAQELLSGYDIILKTFAAKVNYLYFIEESLRVQVK